MNTTSFIQKFAPALTSDRPPEDRDPRLLMDSNDGLSIYYAPFEYINPAARVVLVGITPGPTQMVNANNAARQVLLAGRDFDEALRAGKSTGAFSGSVLRRNLVAQLNHWGFPAWLGLSDAAELFSSAQHLVQTTSLLRFPVFKAGKEYGGTPDMTKQPLLKRYLMEHFVNEVSQLPEAIFVSLGPQVQKTLDSLVRDGVLAPERVVTGMLHPSPNCTYRITYLLGDRSGPVPHCTNPAPYDAGLQAFRQRYLAAKA